MAANTEITCDCGSLVDTADDVLHPSPSVTNDIANEDGLSDGLLGNV